MALRSGIPPLLEVHEIHTAYGKVRVLDSVSLEVWPGEIVSIIGPNGAGKSTVLKSVMGILTPMRGEVVFDGNRSPGYGPTSPCTAELPTCRRGGSFSRR